MPTLEYAKAFMSIASEENISNFRIFSENLNKDFYKLMDSYAISKNEKKSMMESVIKDENLLNFIKVLIDNNRLNLINDINIEMNKIIDKLENKMTIDVYSNIELDQKELDFINDGLTKKFNCEVILKNKVDNTLIGGIKIMYGDKIIDNSIKNKLEAFKNNLIK